MVNGGYKMIEIKDKILGSQVYGRKNRLEGIITDIYHDTNTPYIGDDVVTIRWNDGQVAKFTRFSIKALIV